MSKKIRVRPGKSQSKAAFVIGIVFCLIGVVVVIPMFGPFGILWTAAAGWIAYSHYRNGFTNKPMDTKVIEIEDNGEDITLTSNTGFGAYSYRTESVEKEQEDKTELEGAEERLTMLQSLYDKALITREEYEQKRKEILKEL